MRNEKQQTEPEEMPEEQKTEAEETPKETAPKARKPEKKSEKKPEKKAEKKPEKKAEKTPPEKTAEDSLREEQDKYLRLLAEYDNFRRRSARERESIYTDVRCDTLKQFLPVYDSLSRALAQTPEDDANHKGLELIMTQFETSLEKLGVTMIEALGRPFDANFHNAVMHVEDAQYGEGEIVEEFEKGFRVGDRVLRYSVVKVAN